MPHRTLQGARSASVMPATTEGVIMPTAQSVLVVNTRLVLAMERVLHVQRASLVRRVLPHVGRVERADTRMSPVPQLVEFVQWADSQ